jgi:hemerythrin
VQRVTSVLFDRSLETGHADIDGQHRELFWRIDRLLAASSHHAGGEELAQTLAFLGEYVLHHFAAELALMTARGYPEVGRHVGEHAGFVEELEAIRRDYQAHGPNTALVVRVGTQLTGWLRDHIQRTDRALVAWLHEEEAAAAHQEARPGTRTRSGPR